MTRPLYRELPQLMNESVNIDVKFNQGSSSTELWGDVYDAWRLFPQGRINGGCITTNAPLNIS
ncbi:hypothetical protein OUZ56_022170 [Daphnia magna]|uniref:Uncharacterized protein n=1 Tax=Daphnia magna TaxID=35525 RepID=A0ABR0AVQ3_9CRUS|nr:hypothetical protein OUZ56_022170 [Daphnia magna]